MVKDPCGAIHPSFHQCRRVRAERAHPACELATSTHNRPAYRVSASQYSIV